MNQANGFSFEFWRVARCRSRHRVDSLRRLSHPKLWFVRRPGSSPALPRLLCFLLHLLLSLLHLLFYPLLSLLYFLLHLLFYLLPLLLHLLFHLLAPLLHFLLRPLLKIFLNPTARRSARYRDESGGEEDGELSSHASPCWDNSCLANSSSDARPSLHPLAAMSFQCPAVIPAIAYLGFPCSKLPTFSACCALSGVKVVSALLWATRDQSLSKESRAGSQRSWRCAGGGPPSPRRPS